MATPGQECLLSLIDTLISRRPHIGDDIGMARPAAWRSPVVTTQPDGLSTADALRTKVTVASIRALVELT
jgi:hypothetical protein